MPSASQAAPLVSPTGRHSEGGSRGLVPPTPGRGSVGSMPLTPGRGSTGSTPPTPQTGVRAENKQVRQKFYR